MGHEAQDVSLRVADAGDVPRRSVRIGVARQSSLDIAVAEDDLAIPLQFVEHRWFGVVVPFAVCDRSAEDLSARNLRGEWRVCFFGAQVDVAAEKSEMLIAH